MAVPAASQGSRARRKLTFYGTSSSIRVQSVTYRVKVPIKGVRAHIHTCCQQNRHDHPGCGRLQPGQKQTQHGNDGCKGLEHLDEGHCQVQVPTGLKKKSQAGEERVEDSGWTGPLERLGSYHDFKAAHDSLGGSGCMALTQGCRSTVIMP